MDNSLITIIPAAGYGTRLLPCSKSIPKELFPIVNKPSIEYIADEVKEAGLKNILIVTAKNKESIVDYFDTNFELNYLLAQKGKTEMLEKINRNNNLNIVTIRQKEQKGLGHAVYMGNHIVGNDSFIVSLPDMLIKNGGYHMKEMLRIHEETGKGVIALMEVDKNETYKYGIVDAIEQNGVMFIHDMVEKPKVEDAPTNLAILGRYILPNKTMFLINNTEPGAGGEIQLTDALQNIARTEGLIGYIVNDEIFDVGNPLGFVKANIAFALGDENLSEDIREFLCSLVGNST